jgi:glycosyltransferase involved in cell wall biosynthesis
MFECSGLLSPESFTTNQAFGRVSQNGGFTSYDQFVTMKTLYVNGRYLAQPITGVQRYAREVVAAWDSQLVDGRIDPSCYSIEVIAPRRVLEVPNYKRIRITTSTTNGRFWEQVELPIRTRGSLLFSPYAAAPVLKRRHAVTIHDAGVRATPQQYSWPFRAYYSAVYWVLGWTALRLFTVSEFSRKELSRYFSIPLDKLIVVHPGCDHLLGTESDLSILAKADIRPGRFALAVSSRSPIKNFEGLIRAWEFLGPKEFELVIAGKSNERIFKTSQSSAKGDVKWLGYVSDGELRGLYESASLFVYPSFYEGFGLPPMEAMSCGCPVLVADSSALPESCGDGALYCDPYSSNDIAEKVSTILERPDLAEQLKILGSRRAKQFTIERTASVLWTEMRELL